MIETVDEEGAVPEKKVAEAPVGESAKLLDVVQQLVESAELVDGLAVNVVQQLELRIVEAEQKLDSLEAQDAQEEAAAGQLEQRIAESENKLDILEAQELAAAGSNVNGLQREALGGPESGLGVRLGVAESSRQELEGIASQLDRRLEELEQGAALEPTAQPSQLLDTFGQERSPRSLGASEINGMAAQLCQRLEVLESGISAAPSRKSLHNGSAAVGLEQGAVERGLKDQIMQLQEQLQAAGPIPSTPFFGVKLSAVGVEQSAVQEVERDVVMEMGKDVVLEAELGVSSETYEAMRLEFERGLAGLSEECKALQRELLLAREEREDLAQHVLLQDQMLQNQEQNTAPDAGQFEECQKALEETRILLCQADAEKSQLSAQLTSHQAEAGAQIAAAQAQQKAATADFADQKSQLSAQLTDHQVEAGAQMAASLAQQDAAIAEFADQTKRMLFLEGNNSILQRELDQTRQELEQGLQNEQIFIKNQKFLNEQVVELEHALSDVAVRSPVQEQVLPQLQGQIEQASADADLANAQVLEARMLDAYDSLQRDVSIWQEKCGNLEGIIESSNNKSLQQDQHIFDLQNQLNQVFEELDVAKRVGGPSNNDDLVEVERLHKKKLKDLEDRQTLLTTEFEAEYTEIRRKEEQMRTKMEEERWMAEKEASNTRLLTEENQQLLIQMEQLKVQLFGQGNAVADALELQQRVEFAEVGAREAFESQEQLRLNAQQDAQVIQELEQDFELLRTEQKNHGQILLEAESKSETYYQQVLRLSADNERLKSERVYLTQELESIAREPAGDGQAIAMLSEENFDLKAQLAATWVKINDQTRKIEEERGVFWAEMDSVRLAAENPVPRPLQPSNMGYTSGTPSTSTSVPPSTSTSVPPSTSSSPLWRDKDPSRPRVAKAVNSPSLRIGLPLGSPGRPSPGRPIALQRSAVVARPARLL